MNYRQIIVPVNTLPREYEFAEGFRVEAEDQRNKKSIDTSTRREMQLNVESQY